MVAYRKQHTAPAEFLKSWSLEDKGRDSRVEAYFLPGLKHARASVGSLCVESYFYSRTQPSVDADYAEIERGMMQRLRNATQKAGVTGATFTAEPDVVPLMFDLVFMFMRSASFENLSAVERCEAIDRQLLCFLRDLADGCASTAPKRDLPDRDLLVTDLAAEFSVAVTPVHHEVGDDLIVCDGPVVLVSGRQSDYGAISMPVTPRGILTAFRKSEYRVVQPQLRDGHVANINGMMGANANRVVCARHPLTIDDQQALFALRNKYPHQRCRYDDGFMQIPRSMGNEAAKHLGLWWP